MPYLNFSSSTPNGEVASVLEPGYFGTYCSFALVIGIMIASIVAQRYAPSYVSNTSWTSDCPAGYEAPCKANSAVLRFSFALVLFFCLQFILTTVSSRLYDTFWIIKLFVFAGVCVGFWNVSSNVFDQNGYAWFARICGFFFLILQQIILLDWSFAWNESWVAKSEASEEGYCGKWRLFFSTIARNTSVLSRFQKCSVVNIEPAGAPKCRRRRRRGVKCESKARKINKQIIIIILIIIIYFLIVKPQTTKSEEMLY